MPGNKIRARTEIRALIVSLSDCFKLLLSVMVANINKIFKTSKQKLPLDEDFAYFESRPPKIAYFESRIADFESQIADFESQSGLPAAQFIMALSNIFGRNCT